MVKYRADITDESLRYIDDCLSRSGDSNEWKI